VFTKSITDNICVIAPQDMSLHEASLLTLRVLKQVMEEKLDERNVQLGVVTPRKSKDGRPSGQFRLLSETELKSLVDAM
jgi:20S proteasome subunit alpha 5